MKKLHLMISAALVVAASTSVMAQSKFEKDHAASFNAKGQAGMDRLDRDDTQKFCSDAAAIAGKGDPKKREAIEKSQHGYYQATF
jgi:sulfur-oxidizing protein SoxX